MVKNKFYIIFILDLFLDSFKENQCKCSSSIGCAPMGHHASNTYPNGKYYLRTNRVEPYCLS